MPLGDIPGLACSSGAVGTWYVRDAAWRLVGSTIWSDLWPVLWAPCLPCDLVLLLTGLEQRSQDGVFEGSVPCCECLCTRVWDLCPCSSFWAPVRTMFLRVQRDHVTCFGQWNVSSSDVWVGAIRDFSSLFASHINPRWPCWGGALVSKWLSSVLDSQWTLSEQDRSHHWVKVPWRRSYLLLPHNLAYPDRSRRNPESVLSTKMKKKMWHLGMTPFTSL
jgi:hypothetical protein